MSDTIEYEMEDTQMTNDDTIIIKQDEGETTKLHDDKEIKDLFDNHLSNVQTEYKIELNDLILEYDNEQPTHFLEIRHQKDRVKIARDKYIQNLNNMVELYENETYENKSYKELLENSISIFDNIIKSMFDEYMEKLMAFNKSKLEQRKMHFQRSELRQPNYVL